MPAKTLRSASATTRHAEIPVRTITSRDLGDALREGWTDFSAMRGDLIFIALLYPLIGLVAATALLGGPLLPLLYPIVMGVALLGPIAALGFYELARRREGGRTGSNWSHFLDVRKRPAAEDIGYVCLLLLGIFALWLLAAGALYLSLWGNVAPASVGAFVSRLFTTSEGWALIVIGNLVGLVFAAMVLATSVVSLPMLVDRDVAATEAVSTSIRAARENPAQMVRWGIIVAALLAIGSIPLFLGLAVVLPWLGYSTWHLYTKLVDRKAIPKTADA